MKTDELKLTTPAFLPVLSIAAINLILLLFLLLVFCSPLINPSGFEIRIPRTTIHEGLKANQTINITAENVLYFNNKVVTLNELKKNLSKIDPKDINVFIQVDKRSSMGRMMDVWNLCRNLGSSRVHIIASQNN